MNDYTFFYLVRIVIYKNILLFLQKYKNIRNKFNSKPQNHKHKHYRFFFKSMYKEEKKEINNASGNNKIRKLLVYGKLSCEIYQEIKKYTRRKQKI